MVNIMIISAVFIVIVIIGLERRLTNLKDVIQKIPFCIDMVAKFLGPVRFSACVDCGDLFVMGRKQNI